MMLGAIRCPFWEIAMVGALLAGAAAGVRAADAPSPEAVSPATPAKPAYDRLSPPEIVVKPVIPSKSELAESAFKKLDALGKGYVTREDTSALAGFDKAFQSADPQQTGRLDLAQFKKAWAEYSGYQQ